MQFQSKDRRKEFLYLSIFYIVTIGVLLYFSKSAIVPLIYGVTYTITHILVNNEKRITINESTIQIQTKYLLIKWGKQKEITPRDIRQIRFQHEGWSDRLAIIKMKREDTIKLASFQNEQDLMYGELEKFCIQNEVPFVKTKTYLLAEKSARLKRASELYEAQRKLKGKSTL